MELGTDGGGNHWAALTHSDQQGSLGSFPTFFSISNGGDTVNLCATIEPLCCYLLCSALQAGGVLVEDKDLFVPTLEIMLHQ